MELKVFNSILFGELRPWFRENRDEKKFKQILTPSFKVPKGGVDAFTKELEKALKDHPQIMEDEEVLISLDTDTNKFEIS